MKKGLLILLVGIGLGACTQKLTLVSPGVHSVGDRYQVTTGAPWNGFEEEGTTVWTSNGFALDSIRFYEGIEEGDSLFAWEGAAEENPLPLYRTDMQATEIAEFVADSLEAIGFHEVTASGLRPIGFGPRAGYRFDTQMLTAEGLEMSGLALVSSDGEALDLILYMAERHYYFPKQLDEVERIFESVSVSA